jgi:hypothetical protein
MSVPKIAAMLSLAGALSLVSHGPAQSTPLTSLSVAAKPGTEQTNAVQVRMRRRRGWHNGAPRGAKRENRRMWPKLPANIPRCLDHVGVLLSARRSGSRQYRQMAAQTICRFSPTRNTAPWFRG